MSGLIAIVLSFLACIAFQFSAPVYAAAEPCMRKLMPSHAALVKSHMTTVGCQ